jgi:hypothetical protein
VWAAEARGLSLLRLLDTFGEPVASLASYVSAAGAVVVMVGSWPAGSEDSWYYSREKPASLEGGRLRAYHAEVGPVLSTGDDG